ncbi:MAG TPA: hypothetical protein PLQ67_10115, partial [Burkholderiaceae bacterium]|nr:hypothetical protein [Burkholderiaceae bacterium]
FPIVQPPSETTNWPPPPPKPAPVEPQVPCLFLAKELSPVLGITPQEGQASSDEPLPTCTYVLPTERLRQVVVTVDARYNAQRYAQRLRLAQRIAASKPIEFTGLGDGAFYVAGVAGVWRGYKYIEISGLRKAANRRLRAQDAEALLRLALERTPRY